MAAPKIFLVPSAILGIITDVESAEEVGRFLLRKADVASDKQLSRPPP
jgi:hypothetical protein